MRQFPFEYQAMPLLGVAVADLDEAVERYQRMFGVTFHVFTAGVDYVVEYANEAGIDTSPTLPSNPRIAVDTNDLFELVEMPGIPSGFRNMHLRVTDIDAATQHLTSSGLTIAQVITAGTAREVVFDASSLDGIRLCLMQFDGPSFAEAMAASPKP